MSNNDNIEIEAKYSILNTNVNGLRQWLEKFAKLDRDTITVDEYYIPPHRNFLDTAYPFEWLRLREDSKGSSINYKHWYPENEKKSTHCDEYETSVEDIKKVRLIFEALNFLNVATVNKQRTTFNLNDMEFALDHVENLGWYLEIEYKGDELTINGANNEFDQFQGQLSKFLGPRDYRGYPFLILEQNGYFGSENT